ncbi:unnamed protein product [Parnassius apollo]|uniref:(apollo) hypothetical protein n=1 Tax=Parnassius apollo TaxID=110799 RepID=A0A8S3W6L8_PARAO|nr:unnamed protein product [Parnassius apollo]
MEPQITGGGVGEYIPPDEILDRVTSLLGNTASGLVVPYGGDKEPEHFVVISDGGGIVPNGNGVEELGGYARVNLEILEFQDTLVPDPQKEMVVTPTSPHSAMAQVNTCAVAKQIKVSDTLRRVTFNVPKTCNGYFDVDRILIYKVKGNCRVMGPNLLETVPLQNIIHLKNCAWSQN